MTRLLIPALALILSAAPAVAQTKEPAGVHGSAQPNGGIRDAGVHGSAAPNGGKTRGLAPACPEGQVRDAAGACAAQAAQPGN